MDTARLPDHSSLSWTRPCRSRGGLRLRLRLAGDVLRLRLALARRPARSARPTRCAPPTGRLGSVAVTPATTESDRHVEVLVSAGARAMLRLGKLVQTARPEPSARAPGGRRASLGVDDPLTSAEAVAQGRDGGGPRRRRATEGHPQRAAAVAALEASLTGTLDPAALKAIADAKKVGEGARSMKGRSTASRTSIRRRAAAHQALSRRR